MGRARDGQRLGWAGASCEQKLGWAETRGRQRLRGGQGPWVGRGWDGNLLPYLTSDFLDKIILRDGGFVSSFFLSLLHLILNSLTVLMNKFQGEAKSAMESLIHQKHLGIFFVSMYFS